MRVLKLRRELNLALEAHQIYCGGKLGWQDLDDHLPTQNHVMGEEHPRHSRRAQLAVEKVGLAERILQTLLKIHVWVVYAIPNT